MTNIIYLLVIAAVALASFCYLAWSLLSVWHSRGWLGDDEVTNRQRASGPAGTTAQTFGFEDCRRFCLEHQYLGEGPRSLSCEEICRAS